VANPLDQQGGGAARQLIERGIAFRTPPDPRTDLDKFVVGECAIQFGNHSVGESGVSQHDDGVQGMRQPAQVFPLLFR